MINPVSPSVAVMVNFSKWGSTRVSGDSGFREKFINLWVKARKPPYWPWRWSFRTVVKFWMLEVLELGETFDSCITATLTLCRCKNLPNSISLLSMPFALNCMMVNEFPSTACVGIDVGCSFGRVGGELQELHTQSLICCILKTRTLRMHPPRTTIA